MWWLWSFWFDVKYFFVTIESNHQSPHFEGDASAEDVGGLRGNHLHMCRLFLVDWHWNLQILSMGHREGMAISGVFQNIKLYQAILQYGFKISSCLTRHGFQHQQTNLFESVCKPFQYHLIPLGRDPLTFSEWSWNLTLNIRLRRWFNSPIILWESDWIPRASSKVPVLRIYFCVSFPCPADILRLGSYSRSRGPILATWTCCLDVSRYVKLLRIPWWWTPTDRGWWSEGWQRKTWEGKVFCNPKSTDSVANSVPFCLALDRLEFSPCTAASKFNQGISLSQVAAVLWRGILAFAAAVEVCHPFFDHTGGDSLYRNPPDNEGARKYWELWGGSVFGFPRFRSWKIMLKSFSGFQLLKGKLPLYNPYIGGTCWYVPLYIYIYMGYSSKGTQLSPLRAGPFGECILYSFQYNGTVGMPLTDGWRETSASVV